MTKLNMRQLIYFAIVLLSHHPIIVSVLSKRKPV